MGSFNMMARESYFGEMIFYLIPKIHSRTNYAKSTVEPTMQNASKRASQVKGGDGYELVMVKEDQIDI